MTTHLTIDDIPPHWKYVLEVVQKTFPSFEFSGIEA